MFACCAVKEVTFETFAFIAPPVPLEDILVKLAVPPVKELIAATGAVKFCT